MKYLLGLFAAFMAMTAAAAPVQYTFSVTNLFEQRSIAVIDPLTGDYVVTVVDATPEQQMFSHVSSISGTFWYDSEAIGADGSYLGGDVYTDIEGSIGGDSFAVTGGWVFVVDEGIRDGETADDAEDLILHSSNQQVLQGFTVTDGTDTFALGTAQLLFREGDTGTGFLDSTALPDTLPPVGAGSRQMSFKFRSTDRNLGHDLRGELTVSAVPVPASVWLFGSGLGLLGWMRRKA